MSDRRVYRSRFAPIQTTRGGPHLIQLSIVAPVKSWPLLRPPVERSVATGVEELRGEEAGAVSFNVVCVAVVYVLVSRGSRVLYAVARMRDAPLPTIHRNETHWLQHQP